MGIAYPSGAVAFGQAARLVGSSRVGRSLQGVAWLVLIAAACGGANGTGPARVTSVQVLPADTILFVGRSASYRALATTADGTGDRTATATWQSSSPTVATVSAAGLVTGVAPGLTTIQATIDGVPGRTAVTVLTPLALSVTNAWLTQGVQQDDRSVPLVAGRPTLLNVFGSLDQIIPSRFTRPRVRVRIYDGPTLLYEDSSPMNGSPGPAASDSTPLHQVRIPTQFVIPGMAFTVEANAGGAFTETDLSDNSWPPTGVPQPIAVVPVAPLNVVLIPVLLTRPGSVDVPNASSADSLLLATRQMHPVAGLQVDVGPTFASDVSLDLGDAAGWSTLLSQLDVVRLAAGTNAYYVGVVPRLSSEMTFTGYGFIPEEPLSHGPGTRTAAVVGTGPDGRLSGSRLVAHELGHTFGRLHAPCGGPLGRDLQYPYPGAFIGAWGTDVYQATPTASATTPVFSPYSRYDLMSYCAPSWASDYTYRGVLAIRNADTATAVAGPVCDCLLVYGTITPDGVDISAPLDYQGQAVAGDPDGGWQLEGRDARGAPLFQTPFRPGRIDHAPGHATFALALPLDARIRSALATLRVRNPAGRAWTRTVLQRVPAMVTARPLSRESVALVWDHSSGGLLVQDPVTHAIIGLGRTGQLLVPRALGQVRVAVGPTSRASGILRLP